MKTTPVYIVLLSLYRGDVLRYYTLAVLLPSLIASVLLTASAGVTSLTSLASSHADGRLQSCCMRVNVLHATITVGNRSIETVLFETSDVAGLLRCTGSSIIASRSGDRISVSIGVHLAERLGLKPGSVAGICAAGMCRWLRVDAIHDGKAQLRYAIVASAALLPTSGEPGEEVCRVDTSAKLRGMAESLAGEVAGILTLLGLAVLVGHTPIAYAAVAQCYTRLRGVLDILVFQGVSRSDARLAFTLASSIAALHASTAGVALGVLLLHATLSLAKLAGMLVPLRPLPPTLVAAVPLCEALIAAASSLAASR